LIEKPFLPEQLATKIREVLGNAGADEATVLVARIPLRFGRYCRRFCMTRGTGWWKPADGGGGLEKCRRATCGWP